jgi:riboflavin synthase
MFTGIIEETGIVEQITRRRNSIDLGVRADLCARRLKIGDSLAVNGCCLTAVSLKTTKKRRRVHFDLLEETWRRTNLQFIRPGSLVNLERSMTTNARFSGHFVTGHIDGMGRIIQWERIGHDHLLEIQTTPQLMRYIIFKGSIAVDGISLTVAKVQKQSLRIWIIPHTFEATALRTRKVGDHVNLETDLLGKYVEKFLRYKIRSLH